MIAKMKKAHLVVIDEFRDDALNALKKLGVLHIELEHGENQALQPLVEKRSRLFEALGLIESAEAGSRKKKGDAKSSPATDSPVDDGVVLGDYILGLEENRKTIEEEVRKLRFEIDSVKSWGNFNPADLGMLEEKGVTVRLMEITSDKLGPLSEQADYIILERVKKSVKVAVINPSSKELPGEFLVPPSGSIAAMEKAILTSNKDINKITREFEALGSKKVILKESIKQCDSEIEYLSIRTSMGTDESLAFLTGFLPVDRVDNLKNVAARQGWGLLLDDPKEEEPVPTLLKNPKWIAIIKPIFDFLGALPGYREFDISFWFLIFFSLFFAMIIGDAGYGAIMLALTIVARLKMRKAPGAFFALMYVMTSATIIWGALTGTWFGSDVIAAAPLISKITLPWIASFPDSESTINTVEVVMNFCFLIGAVHLTIARLICFIKSLPRLSSIAELGWVPMLWGLYLLVRNIVLQKELHFLAIWLIGAGFILVVLFSEQNGKFFKGLGLGLVKSPLKALDVIGGFSDIISYVRLFAVGLATVEVAKAFNIMVMDIGFGDIAAGIISALILFLGHSLNIVMGAMSIIVHGVRLNMLEFSGHLGMEWAGKEYKPFKE